MDPDDKRQNKANQAFVSVCFVGFALIIISYFFYAYPWYYTQYAVMYSLNWLPDIVTDIGFFWVDEASKTIELMYNDLEYRRNDFSECSYLRYDLVSYSLTFCVPQLNIIARSALYVRPRKI